MDRRSFLKSAGGFAATLLSLNRVHEMKLFDVNEAEASDDDAAVEARAKTGGQFIVDCDTHLGYRQGGYPAASPRGRLMLQFFDEMRKAVDPTSRGILDEDVEGYVTDMWMKSETDIAILQGFGWREDFGGLDFIPVAEVAKARDRAPERTILLGAGYSLNEEIKGTLEHVEREAVSVRTAEAYLGADAEPVQGGGDLAYPLHRELQVVLPGGTRGDAERGLAHAEDRVLGELARLEGELLPQLLVLEVEVEGLHRRCFVDDLLDDRYVRQVDVAAGGKRRAL